VHQMIGIVPDKVRSLYKVPDGVQPLTALAFGYAADPSTLPDALKPRDWPRAPGSHWPTSSSAALLEHHPDS